MINGQDLLKSPEELETFDNVENCGVEETPFDRGIDAITQIKGEKLEITTRMNPQIANAGQIALMYRHRYPHLKVVTDAFDQLERFAISTNGEGRHEVIDVTKAGCGSYSESVEMSADPDSKRTFTPVNDGE